MAKLSIGKTFIWLDNETLPGIKTTMCAIQLSRALTFSIDMYVHGEVHRISHKIRHLHNKYLHFKGSLVTRIYRIAGKFGG